MRCARSPCRENARPGTSHACFAGVRQVASATLLNSPRGCGSCLVFCSRGDRASRATDISDVAAPRFQIEAAFIPRGGDAGVVDVPRRDAARSRADGRTTAAPDSMAAGACWHEALRQIIGTSARKRSSHRSMSRLAGDLPLTASPDGSFAGFRPVRGRSARALRAGARCFVEQDLLWPRRRRAADHRRTDLLLS